MLRFSFKLRPLEEIPPNWIQSWYFLTDGWYWIDTDANQLFRYSEQQLTAWQSKGYNEALLHNGLSRIFAR